MTNAKPSFWTRMKWVFVGKPISHEEAQAARFRPSADAAPQIQNGVRSSSAGGFHL